MTRTPVDIADLANDKQFQAFIKRLRTTRERKVRNHNKAQAERASIDARRRAETTTTIPLDLSGVYEDLGHLIINSDALTSALVTLQQRRIGAPTGKAKTKQEDKQRFEEVEKLRAGVRPMAEELIRALPINLQKWLDSLVTVWGREQVLTVLEDWPKDAAVETLAMPTVRIHINRIRSGRTEADERARKRLEKALHRLARDRAKPGRRRGGDFDHARAAIAYGELRNRLNELKDGYGLETDDALSALRSILHDFLIPPKAGDARRWLRSIKTQKPHRVAASMLAGRFATSIQQIEKVVTSRRTQI